MDGPQMQKILTADSATLRSTKGSRLSKMKTTTIEGEDVAAAVETEEGGQTKRNSQVVDKQSDMSMQNVKGDYQEKNRLVNLKKDKELRFDPHMPFQNVQLKNDYYIVPT